LTDLVVQLGLDERLVEGNKNGTEGKKACALGNIPANTLLLFL
jgi:hypothetical protein